MYVQCMYVQYMYSLYEQCYPVLYRLCSRSPRAQRRGSRGATPLAARVGVALQGSYGMWYGRHGHHLQGTTAYLGAAGILYRSLPPPPPPHGLRATGGSSSRGTRPFFLLRGGLAAGRPVEAVRLPLSACQPAGGVAGGRVWPPPASLPTGRAAGSGGCRRFSPWGCFPATASGVRRGQRGCLAKGVPGLPAAPVSASRAGRERLRERSATVAVAVAGGGDRGDGRDPVHPVGAPDLHQWSLSSRLRVAKGTALTRAPRHGPCVCIFTTPRRGGLNL